MKNIKYFIFSLICLFSCNIVFAENEVIIKSITPIYDENSSVVVSNEGNNYDVIFNDENQNVSYSIVLENKSEDKLKVSDINLTKASKDFIVYNIKGITEGDNIKTNETKEIVVSVKTVSKNNSGENFNEELLATISFEKIETISDIVNDVVENPFTSTRGIIVILLLAAIVTGASIIIYRKNKLPRYMAILIMFASIMPVVNAKEDIDLQFKLNISYISSEVEKEEDKTTEEDTNKENNNQEDGTIKDENNNQDDSTTNDDNTNEENKVPEQVNLLKNKTALFIGDSVQYGQGNNGKGWSYYINEEYSMTSVTNVAVSGSSFTKDSSNTDRIINQFKNNTGTYDYVILEGGINDLTYGSTWGTLEDEFYLVNDSNVVVEAMEETIYTALTKFPNAKFGYILLYNSEDSGRSGHSTQLESYYSLLISVLNKWNIPVFDMYNGTVTYNGKTVTFDELLDVHNKTYLYDGLHLNDEGYKLTYDYIAEWMQTLTTVEIPEIKEKEVEPEIFNGLTVATTIADLGWTRGYQINTSSGAYQNVGTSKPGRLSSVGYVLKVSGGETITLSDSDNYNFAIYELNANNSSSGVIADYWETDSITLNSNTRYIKFYLKKTSEVEWTDDEIENIPNIIKVTK